MGKTIARGASGGARVVVSLLTAVVLAIGLTPLPAQALAAEGGSGLTAGSGGPLLSAQADDDSMSGTSGTCSWSIDASGKLVIEPTSGDSGTLGYCELIHELIHRVTVSPGHRRVALGAATARQQASGYAALRLR